MKSPNQMTNAELIENASLSAIFIKAVLVRSVFDSGIYIGRNDALNEVYTANFKDPKNLAFVDRFFIPEIKRLLAEADKRQMSAVPQMFTPQGLYAIQLGTVSAFTFEEITHILFPPKQADRRQEMGQVLQFPLHLVHQA